MNKLITGQTEAEWNAEHREGGYIPLNHIDATRREDGTWSIDLRGSLRRIGVISPRQNGEEWAFYPLLDVKLTEEQQMEIAEASLIASGRI